MASLTKLGRASEGLSVVRLATGMIYDWEGEPVLMGQFSKMGIVWVNKKWISIRIFFCRIVLAAERDYLMQRFLASYVASLPCDPPP